MKKLAPIVLLVSSTFSFGGCAKKITGPSPSVTALAPVAVCQAQLTTSVAIIGAGLSPLYTGALKTGQLELPTVTLTESKGIDGSASAGTATATITDDPKMPGASHVRWTDQMNMSFDFTPDLMLSPGLYDVTLTNSNGNKGSISGDAGLLAVPPPSLDAIVADLVCSDLENSIKLTGDFFIKTATTAPKVKIGNDTVGTVTLDPTFDDADCRALPGAGGFKACKAMTIKLIAGALKPGDYPVVVTNPDPVGCASTKAVNLTVVPPPKLTSMVPDLACTADGDVSVTITGTGILSVDGHDAGVNFGTMSLAGTASNCTDLPPPPAGTRAEAVKTCTTLTFSVAKGTASGDYMVSIQNPAPVPCMSNSSQFTVIDHPAITSVQPTAVCSVDPMTQLTLTGGNFVVVGTMTPTVKIGTHAPYTATVPATAVCTTVMGVTETAKVCNQIAITVANGDLTGGPQSVTVTNPAPLGCSSDGTSQIDVTTPPVLTAVAPATVCAGNATLTLTGTNFAPTATVTLHPHGATSATGDVKASMVTVNAAGTSAVAQFGGGLNTSPPKYDVTISNGVPGSACSSTLAGTDGAVSVVPGPAIFFVDPRVVYNQLNVQATIYGTGFTNPVTAVEISLDGTTWTPLTSSIKPDPAKPNQVQVTIPAGTPAGSYAVRLTDTSGAACPAIINGALTVVDKSFALTSVTPAFGWTMQSTGVAIKTTDANPFVAVPRVYLNPSTPGPTTSATALGAVTFIDKDNLTALVPPGLAAGSYDVIVVDPNGTIGVAKGGFTVTSAAPPRITDLSPGSVVNATGQTFNVLGQNFKQPTVTLSCIDTGGNAIATNPTAAVSASTATSATVTFDASNAGAACVVRVMNMDKSYDEFSAIVITNPAANLYPAKDGPNLITARRAPVTLDGAASNAARYLHVIGGDDGAGKGFDTVESAPLSLFGVPSAFAAQRNKLTQPRAFAGGARIGRFLYVAGGVSGTTRLKTIERSVVLRPDDRVAINDLGFTVVKPPGTGLSPGVYYYRVSAVMAATDPFNPGGENLPSDPFPVQVPDLQNNKLQITVLWAAQTGVQKYVVYRSAVPGAVAGTEEKIGEVDGTTTQFSDTGITPAAGAPTPLPIGSTGVWTAVVAQLATPREGPGVTMAMDPATAGRAYLYVLGGRSDPTTALGSYEFLPITINADGSQTPATSFTAGSATIGTGRWQLSAAAGVNQLSPRIPAGTTYVYALSGVNAAGAGMVRDATVGSVKAGGDLGAFADVNGPAGLQSAGYVGVVAGDFVFAFGGSNATPDTKVVSGQIKATPPAVTNFNAGQTMNVARYLMGGTLSGAYIYVTGGVTVAAPLQLTNTTEYRLW